ncbi:hypothetical protein SAMN05216565_1286 [Litchfieldia salsa]|uniref:Uncharacterized protein n=1 Tax=Litchfieldia salsa TaxID=930152 RepID=A0A1H0X376_9BACI|nr:hypothetical protein SAMN05216565_1286 [Litchfieldia salsa]
MTHILMMKWRTDSYNFIVSPPLPDHISGLKLMFEEFSMPNKVNPTGLEFIIQID